jgi:hypothetical protein
MKLLQQQSIHRIKFLPVMLLALAILFAIPSQVRAEDPPEEEPKEFRFEDEALLNFFDINQSISVLQRETQERIGLAVEGFGLTMDRFNQIANASRIGALQGGAFSDEEIAAFNEAAPQVTAIQREMQQDMQTIIIEHGLSPQEYQEILTDYRADADLQNHVRELLRERARQRILEERRREREEQAAQEEETNAPE